MVSAEDSAARTQPASAEQMPRKGANGWLWNALFSGPMPQRCRRWNLLRKLRAELAE